LFDRVLDTILRHHMFAAGDRLGVAVSGGPDSVFLVHILMEMRTRWALNLTVLHVDHQLRGEASREDARFVENLAASLGLPFLLELANPAAVHDNLEQAARNARLAFFHRLIAEGAVNKIATGHTLSDQAETVLLRMLRGSGASGLAGILPVTREGIVRPLLSVPRSEIEAWLRQRGIVSKNDETNRSPVFLRNRIRLNLLPLIESQYNPAIAPLLAQTADVLGEEDAFLDQLAAGTAARCFQSRHGAIVVPTTRFADEPRALARRLVRQAIQQIRGDLRQVGFSHVEQVLRIAAAPEGHARVILPGVDVMRSFDWIRFAPPRLDAGQRRIQTVPLQIPGDSALPGGRGLIRTRITNRYNVHQEQPVHWDQLDWESLRPPLELRYWLPGDFYQPAGSCGPEKLKQMFQSGRIPLWDRRFWPIIENSQGIVWSRQFGPSACFQATPESQTVLEIAEVENSPILGNQIPPG
jgi:tRNA(Ile)-lysidine synthase